LYNEKHSRHGAGGWRAVGDYFGISGTYAREIAYELKPVTIEVAEAWLVATGQRQIKVEVLPCPSCGNPHGAGLDCHGEPIAAVVILRKGERVASIPGPRRIRQRATLQVRPETRVKLRAACLPGESFDAVIRRLLEEEVCESGNIVNTCLVKNGGLL